MDEPFYPALDEKNLYAIGRMYAANPQLFDHPKCPYSENTKKLFKGEADFHYFDTHGGGAIPSDDDVLTEITKVYQMLMKYGEEVQSSDKGADKNTFFRVSVSLLEKIVALKERVSNLQQVNLFIQETLNIMDEILTPDQRNEVMSRLQKFNIVGEQNEELSS